MSNPVVLNYDCMRSTPDALEDKSSKITEEGQAMVGVLVKDEIEIPSRAPHITVIVCNL